MEQPVGYYCGYRLVETTTITKLVPCRTHRKRRINKKWAKRYGYKTVLADDVIIPAGNCLYATPKTIQKLISEAKGEQQ